jgi:hypothetical protein
MVQVASFLPPASRLQPPYPLPPTPYPLPPTPYPLPPTPYPLPPTPNPLPPYSPHPPLQAMAREVASPSARLSYGVDAQTRYQQADTRALQAYCAIVEALVPVAIEVAVSSVMGMVQAWAGAGAPGQSAAAVQHFHSVFRDQLGGVVAEEAGDGSAPVERLAPVLLDILMYEVGVCVQVNCRLCARTRTVGALLPECLLPCARMCIWNRSGWEEVGMSLATPCSQRVPLHRCCWLVPLGMSSHRLCMTQRCDLCVSC